MIFTLSAAWLVFFGLAQLAWGQDLGRAPELGVAARNLSVDFKLPPLRNAPGSDLSVQLAAQQAGKRAVALGIGPKSADEAWMAADHTLQSAQARLRSMIPDDFQVFTGTRASQLNALLRDPAIRAVRVTSAVLEIDAAVLLRREKFWLDLGSAELRAAKDGPRFLLRVENSSDIVVSGGVFAKGQWAVVVDGSRDVTLRGGRYDGLQGGGVVLNDAAGVIIANALLTRLSAAPILIHGNTVGAAVLDNEITGNLGSSNWNAGIVITDRNGAVADDPGSILGPDHYGVREQPIQTRLHPPRHNLVAFNRIALNASAGIYSDGGSELVIFDNRVEGNAKEGVCLDNGSAANVLTMNLIRANGKRWGKSDAELRLDFVDALGRLPDGTSPAKTPGVSLDNALYNIVYANLIERNYGGGVKMVRTAYFNTIGLNTIIDNNEGASSRFHFFGVELGAAKADVPVSDLDFTPCRGNVVFGNTIRGTHYAGIFLGPGSTENDVFDNSVFGATDWALEQDRAQPNSSLNNLTNLPSRNIDNGLDPNLLKASEARHD